MPGGFCAALTTVSCYQALFYANNDDDASEIADFLPPPAATILGVEPAPSNARRAPKVPKSALDPTPGGTYSERFNNP